jgi:1-acyl-sn-glycerol-3-phosphate acyltransferase
MLSHHHRQYRLASRFLWGFTRTFIRVRSSGIEHIPRKGAYLLVANHLSHFDPPLIGSTLPHPITWLVARDMYQFPLLAWFFEATGCIPLSRGAPDPQSLRAAVRELRAGQPVGVFPEGGLRTGAASVLGGAAMPAAVGTLARLGGAPVIPLIILHAEQLYRPSAWWPRRTEVEIVAGHPLVPPRDAEECPAFAQKIASLWRSMATKKT